MQYSIIVPIYNDGYLAKAFCIELQKVFVSYLNLNNIENEIELIFINDGSKNDSLLELKKLISEFPFVKIIDLSRNFGQHIALSCGYKFAKGEFVIMLNVDMQDPPSEIIKLIQFMNSENCDIVYSLVHRRETSVINRLTSKLFNRIMNFLTQEKIPDDVSTLRIMSRKFIDNYNLLTEKSRYIPGIENWLGFKKGYVLINHKQRLIGKSSYNLKKRISMAFESIISFSDFPLRLIVGFGIVICFIGFLLTTFLVLSKLFFVDYQPGYTTTISLITFLGGVQIMVIGLASLYIGRILREVQNRPLYLINEKINIS
jgi:glycosyltransferase involved in cell wall biosynthesis